MSAWFPQTELDHRRIGQWVSQRISGGIDLSGPFYGLGISREVDGVARLMAAAIYSDLRDNVAQISFAADAPRWATRQTVSLVLGYAFWHRPAGLGLRRLTSLSRADNKRDHKLIEGIGFKREGTILDFYEDCHGVLHGMTARYFNKSKWNEQKSTDSQRAACA